ncbi:MAG: radical SAM family heme chaperone HemW [Clostridia bacterium]|nr:radical SAM family heme chaperone HemW [Clostridia bacterium]
MTDKTLVNKSIGIYIHVPFCLSKCSYCDFYSNPLAHSKEYADSYADAVIKYLHAASAYLGDRTVDTVYFGGGTPTVLPSRSLVTVLDSVFQYFNVDAEAEITTECNPGTANLDYFKDLRSAGFNRLSMGAQSFNDNELRILGRIHTSDGFVRAYSDASLAGFDNISADLMYGIPEQTEQSFAFSVDRLVSLAPAHISSYALTLEVGTPLYKRTGELPFPDEDTTANMYSALVDTLAQNGYNRYEISNFAKKDRESRHNLRYWQCLDYLGVGPGAHSCIDGIRFSTVTSTEAFLSEKDFPTSLRNITETPLTDTVEHLTKTDAATEFLMLGLRLARGVSLDELQTRFDVSIDTLLDTPLDPYIGQGFMTLTDGVLAFTDKGFFVSNYILSDLLSF